MFLRASFSYHTSSTNHTFIGVCLGVFVLFILFFLEPFSSGESNFPFKTAYLTIYGIITFITYYIMHLFSILYYKNFKIWRLFEEMIFCLVFIVVSILIAFFYTEIIINKNPERLNIDHFFNWFKTIFLGFGILLFVTAILLRQRFTQENSINILKDLENTGFSNSKSIMISSSLKKESFTVDKTNLVYVKAENNYVLIFYFKENLLKEKLLRNTLSNIKKQLPSFVKIHRSYIVNPIFIHTIKGSKKNAKLYLKKVELGIPISQPFFETINELINNPR